MGKGRIVGKKAFQGLVLPNKWDNNGKIIGIAIPTNKEDIYLVSHNRMESELSSHLHLKVEIQAKIMERLDGSKIIYVGSFNPLRIDDLR